jgi:AcrR family transcriptional regulator
MNSPPPTTPPPTPPPAEEAHERSTRDRIVETAMRLFHEQGYHATGVATILREAGVNSGSLYHYFAGKEALLTAVLETYVEMLGPIVLAPAEQATDDPIERIFALLAWYRMGLEITGCTKGCPIGNLALELADDLPGARELIDLNFRNWASGVGAWIDAAGDRLPADTDRARLAHFVLTVMEGGVMQARAAQSLEPYDDAVAQLRHYFALLQKSAQQGD